MEINLNYHGKVRTKANCHGIWLTSLTPGFMGSKLVLSLLAPICLGCFDGSPPIWTDG